MSKRDEKKISIIYQQSLTISSAKHLDDLSIKDDCGKELHHQIKI